MIEPMMSGNKRSNGVHSLAVYCERCHHYPDAGKSIDGNPVDRTISMKLWRRAGQGADVA